MSGWKAAALGVACAGLLAVGTQAAPAGGGLRTLNGPAGGQAIFGPIIDQTTLAGALGEALRGLHGRFADRPQIGRLFRARGSNTIATFFQLHINGQANRPVLGLVIVAAPPGAHPSVWIAYDQANRFRTSGPALLQAMDAATGRPSRPVGGPAVGGGPGAPRPTGPAQPLHRVGFADGSGSIGLPAGWRLTSSGAGSAQAAGPRGERVTMGALFQGILDPRAPGAQTSARFAAMSHTQLLVCPYGEDLARSFASIAGQLAARQGRPPPAIRFIRQEPSAPSPYEAQAVLLLAEIDSHDGRGALMSSIRVGAMRPITPGHWAMTVTQVSTPRALANAEWPTLEAIGASYLQNGQVIGAQARRVVAQIRSEGESSRQTAAGVSAEYDRYNRGVEANRDIQDRSNQDFSNYLRGQTVVQDNEQAARSTMDYGQADAFVKLRPDRYQYVPSQDFLKGIDY